MSDDQDKRPENENDLQKDAKNYLISRIGITALIIGASALIIAEQYPRMQTHLVSFMLVAASVLAAIFSSAVTLYAAWRYGKRNRP